MDERFNEIGADFDDLFDDNNSVTVDSSKVENSESVEIPDNIEEDEVTNDEPSSNEPLPDNEDLDV